MFLVVGRSGRAQLKRILFNHSRCLSEAPRTWPTPRASVDPDGRTPFRDYRKSRVIDQSPFGGILHALAPYVTYNWVFWAEAKDEAYSRALLRIVQDHESLADSDILHLMDCGGRPLEASIDKAAQSIIGVSSDTHKYDKRVIIRLALINLERGAYTTCRFLLCPVRDDERPGRQTLILPDDKAKGVFDRVVTVDPAFARSQWGQRLEYLNEEERDPEARSKLIEEIRGLFESVYDDMEARPHTRATAAKHLGKVYLDPRLLGVNERLAVMWLERAYSVDDPEVGRSAFAAAFHLGRIYAGGRTSRPTHQVTKVVDPVPSDMEKAIQFLDYARRVMPAAAWELGRIFYLDPLDRCSGSRENHLRYYGVEPDNERAALCFFKASSDGIRPAKIKYAEMLINGTAHPPIPLDEQEKLRRMNRPRRGATDDEEEGTEEDYRAEDHERSAITFAPRSRLETLKYAEHVLRDLYDPATRQLKLNRDHANSPIWILRDLIDDIRFMGGVEPVAFPGQDILQHTNGGPRFSRNR